MSVMQKLREKGFFDLVYYIFGDLFVKGMMFITLPLLSLFLSPAEYGTLSILSTMLTFFAVIFSINIENSINNYYMQKHNDFGSYLFSNITFALLVQIFTILIYIFFIQRISEFFKVTEYDSLLVAIICMVIFYYNVYTLYLQGSKQSKLYTKINISNKTIEIALLIGFSYFLISEKYLSKMYAQIIALAIFTPYIIIKIKNLCVFTFKFSHVKHSLLFSIPLIPHVLSNTILSQSDRVMINSILGETETGLYSFAYNLGLSITVVIAAWNSMWQPRFYEYYQEKNNELIKNSINFYGKIITLIAILAIIFTAPIIKLFISVEYHPSLKIIPIILASNFLFLQYYIYVNYSFYHRKTFIISLSTAFAAILNILLNYYLIPIFHASGAAYATLVSYMALSIIHFINAKVISKNNCISLWDAFKWTIPIFISASISIWLS
ncbi:lipopolysaccharide biosynthesis protein [Morganella morganii]|uniref:lipopolysaccharide biosynthesis protein n=1 Tax=Morganella morganii TaxID=582 RepID=UPI001BDA3036|nr:oligosaccharide flippase family protein [Morganella morganii]MBT0386014.1 oligosaccharide flippase family protein [Morganella morganii subsp. morganii]